MSLLRLTALVRRSSTLGAIVIAASMLPAAPARGDNSALTELVGAAAQRLRIAEPVAAFKWKTHGAIEDPVRVQQELAELSADAAAQHIDADFVSRVFGDQIDATTGIEYRRFADWTLDPASAPTQAPDLSVSRSTIDGLNKTMLAQLAAHRELLRGPVCGPQLDAALADVTRADQLDDLYKQALARATSSYCT
ncbi:chorismate mutase [Mycobacterium simiae]|uniref:chorismate mutase n=1 Tax=Mycobacterium simiae TaxID=1784 RepID=UPI0009DC2F6B|nr:chorismate mutase [Mycobacterium simiae]PLV53557.1 chorismate mutase [Mycobacterium tuberculosis variant microti OV254]BBX43636.1 secreted chorismate mutase [Mycobacterium simiae]